MSDTAAIFFGKVLIVIIAWEVIRPILQGTAFALFDLIAERWRSK